MAATKKKASRKCLDCFINLTEDNCYPKVFKTGSGCCKPCSATRQRKWNRDNPEKAKQSCRNNYRKHKRDWAKRLQRLDIKHSILCRTHLKKEGVSPTDMLWRFNFYLSLMNSAICYYWQGPLSPQGHGLDRLDNKGKHTCYNVVPCCGQCNKIKSDHLSYKEMMLLTPALRKIREQRELAGVNSGY